MFRSRSFITLLACLAMASVAFAAKPRSSPWDSADTVEMFAALKAGQIDVKLVPKDATQATVIVENKTDRPLRVKMPEAFAGVPVLAQAGRNVGVGGGAGGFGNQGGLGGGNNQNNNQQNQSFGGGMGGMGGMMGGMGGMGGMGMGGMGGMFNVPPEKVVKAKVATVCLEHGKSDPNPRVAYEIRDIKEVTHDSRVVDLCKLLGYGKLNQSTAQAAAWHLTDGLSWQELVSKVKMTHLDGTFELYFNRGQILQAQQVVGFVTAQAEQTKTVSPGESAAPGI